MREDFSLPKGALVLASQSPTRQKMLDNAGVSFIARAANVDEEGLRASATASSMLTGDIAVMLADMKARKVAHDNGDHPSGFVLGATRSLSVTTRFWANLGIMRWLRRNCGCCLARRTSW